MSLALLLIESSIPSKNTRWKLSISVYLIWLIDWYLIYLISDLLSTVHRIFLEILQLGITDILGCKKQIFRHVNQNSFYLIGELSIWEYSFSKLDMDKRMLGPNCWVCSVQWVEKLSFTNFSSSITVPKLSPQDVTSSSI